MSGSGVNAGVYKQFTVHIFDSITGGTHVIKDIGITGKAGPAPACETPNASTLTIVHPGITY